MGKKNRFKNMLIISVSIAVTVAMMAIWFSPVADSSGQSQSGTSAVVRMSPFTGIQSDYGANMSYNVVQSGFGPAVNLWINYSLPDYGYALGQNVTDFSSIGFAQANVSGSNLSLFISFNPSVAHESGSLSASISNVSGSDPTYFFQKNESGWSSVLGDLITSTSSFSSVAAFAGAFSVDISDVIAQFLGYSVSAATALAPVFVVILGALAIDFAALYALAQIEHYPAFYCEIGMSWPTGWLFFLHPGYLGAYGEEGLYSGNPDTYSGTYLPFLVVGGAGNALANGEVAHNGPWNNVEEPPW